MSPDLCATRSDNVRSLLFFPAVSSVGKFFLEFINPSRRIDEFYFASVKWMAHAANIDFEFRFRCSRRKFVSTAAGKLSFDIFWMNVFFHSSLAMLSRNPVRTTDHPLYQNREKMKGGVQIPPSIFESVYLR